MLKKIIWATVFAITLIPQIASAQVEVILGGIVAKDALNKLNENVTGKITQAAMSGDYLMEKAARELQMLLANSDVVLKDNTDRTFDKLTQQQQQFLKSALEMSNNLDSLANRVMSIEQFAAMDLNTILGQLPFIKADTFLLRQVRGYSQVYRDKGSYKVQFTGQAFKSNRQVKVSINGQAIQLLPFSQDYLAVAEVPVELVNAAFDDRKVQRLKIKVESWEQRGRIKAILFGAQKKVLDYETELLLLPKRPTSLELMEVTAGKGWSDQVLSVSAQGMAYPTGSSGNWRTYEVSVAIPTGTRMIQERTNSWVSAGVGAGTWGNWCSGYTFSDQGEGGPQRVSRQFCHQIHDQSRTLVMEAFYRKPVVVEGRRLVPLKEALSDSEAKDGLAYGVLYEGTFTNEYAGFYAGFKLFNGQMIQLTQSSPSQAGIEIQPNIQSGIKKVTVKLNNPYEKLLD
jgi:hypothetical protein